MRVKMIKNLENKMEKIQESINKDWEELNNNHTNNTITEIKNTLEGINFRISEAEEWVSEEIAKISKWDLTNLTAFAQ
jgi:paraquat-inducible protein B